MPAGFWKETTSSGQERHEKSKAKKEEKEEKEDCLGGVFPLFFKKCWCRLVFF